MKTQRYIFAVWCDGRPTVYPYGFTVNAIYSAGTSAWVIVLDWDGTTPAGSLNYSIQDTPQLGAGILVHDVTDVVYINQTGT